MQVQLQPSATSTTASQRAGNGASNVDFQSFLRLLTAQLRNQDPLSPLDSTQFVAQLASFSTVEQLISANTRLDTIETKLTGGSLSDYAGWIGRTAEIPGLPARFEGAPVPVGVEARPGAARMELIIRDSTGAETGRAAVPPDGGTVLWDGTGAKLGEAYHFEVEYSFTDGTSAAVPASTFSAISAVRQADDGVTLDFANGFSAPATVVRGLSL